MLVVSSMYKSRIIFCAKSMSRLVKSYLLICICNVPSRINALLFKPNILVKRKVTMLGLSAVIASYQKNRKKSR